MPTRFDSMIPKGLMVLYAMLVVIVLTNGARAADDCLAAPISDPLQGNHWYYWIDGVQHRRCWYLGPERQKIRHQEPDVQSMAKSAAPMRTETDWLTASAQAEPTVPAPGITAAARATGYAGVDEMAQEAPLGTPAIAQWPDPGPATGEGASTLQDLNAADEVARSAAAMAGNARTIMMIRVALLVVGALAVAASIFQHAISGMVVTRRRRVYVKRGHAERTRNSAREQRSPAFAASRPNGPQTRAVERAIDCPRRGAF